MKSQGSAKAPLDGSIPCCASTSLPVYCGFEPRDPQKGFYFTSRRRSPGSAKVTVAVVDDNLRVLKTLGDLLGSAGYDARLFSSGEEFLASPDIRNTRCFISDIDMSGMNGIDLLRRIKAQGMELPCILLTGRDDTDTVLFCRTEGARFILLKPIVGPELLAAVALVTNCLSPSRQIGFVGALRSAVSRASSALFGRSEDPAHSHKPRR